MPTWTTEQLDQISRAVELDITSPRKNGSLRRYRTIWMVRVGDNLFVRSAHGPDNPWFRDALQTGHGRIQVGGTEHDVTFTPAPPDLADDIDAAYHTKYDQYGPRIVGAILGPEAAGTTLHVTPA